MEYILGRDPRRCDVAIDDNAVSGKHARIIHENGKYYIEDLHSTNGTIVNNRKISGIRQISSNDQIIIGNMQILLSPDGKISYYPLNKGNNRQPSRSSSQNNDKVYRIVRQLTIGRSKSNDITIGHPNASREHARLENRNGGYYLYDLRSTNGTFVNGRKVNREHQLNNGDSIMIANVELHYNDGQIASRPVFNKSRAKSGSQSVAIKVNNLSKTFTNGVIKKKSKTVLHNISTEINVGEFVVILGTSGAGKSVFMSCLNGSEIVEKNSVTYANKDYSYNEGFRQCIGAYVPQEDIIYMDLSVERCLYHSLKLRSRDMKYTEEEMQRTLNEVLDMVNLQEHRTTLVKKLSGGQKKRVSIAQEFLSKPDLIFLDEPTSGLDPGTEFSLMDTFSKMTASSSRTVIMVTHDIANIDLCSRVIILGTGGYLCYSGSYDGIKSFFGVDRIGKIYPLIENAEGAKKWADKFAARGYA